MRVYILSFSFGNLVLLHVSIYYVHTHWQHAELSRQKLMCVMHVHLTTNYLLACSMLYIYIIIMLPVYIEYTIVTVMYVYTVMKIEPQKLLQFNHEALFCFLPE